MEKLRELTPGQVMVVVAAAIVLIWGGNSLVKVLHSPPELQLSSTIPMHKATSPTRATPKSAQTITAASSPTPTITPTATATPRPT
ncbi:MAG: hypothetical protein P1S60_20770, partial [Anaerolineae bacterium]|nr:hypothetical protein [Anaerolineae bacterium]